jgi:FAD:protein FMN transferase
VVAEFLNSNRIESYVVEIGGEVFAKGKKPNGDFWTVGIEKPIDNTEPNNPLKAIVTLENLAIATSGNYRKFTIVDGIKYAHHIDPKTGYPTKNNLLSASVFSKECISSDANATGILVMGLEKAISFLKLHPELQAYLIYSDEKGNYQIYETPALKSILSESDEQ